MDVRGCPLSSKTDQTSASNILQSRWMALAFEEAEAAARRGEVPVGAVVVDGQTGKLLARAGNRVEEFHDPTAHAEMLAIRAACQEKGDTRLPDCDLYVTLEPCALCATAISFARIRRLYYGAGDEKGGAVDHGPRFFQQDTCHHKPVEIHEGFEVDRSKALLQAFFKGLR